MSKQFQSGSSQMGVMNSEIRRLLRSLLGKFVQTKVIVAASDITKVDYTNGLHQHEDNNIAVGWRARQFLYEHDVAPYTTEKFFSAVRAFYQSVVKVMLAKFPFGNRKLKAMGYLNPAFRMNVTSSQVQLLRAAFLSKERECLNALEREAGDYLVTPREELPMTKFPAKDVTMEAFWSDMEKVTTKAGEHRFTTLCNLSKIILTLPHSNADIERVFSIVMKIQTNSRNNLGQEALENIPAVKLNNPWACRLYQPDYNTLTAAKHACFAYNEENKEIICVYCM